MPIWHAFVTKSLFKFVLKEQLTVAYDVTKGWMGDKLFDGRE